MAFNKEFINSGEDLYLVKRKFRDDKSIKVDAWKEYLSADKVFRSQGMLFFCELIPIIEILPEETSLQSIKDDTRTNNTNSDVNGV